MAFAVSTWARDPAEARKIQGTLCRHCVLQRTIDACEIRYVAGADAAYSPDKIHAAVVVLTLPGLRVVEKSCSVQEIPFPYVPGLLAFREGPAIADAFHRLVQVPDLLFVNGHGYAHPERIGIACHLGIVLDVPSIGIAQHLLTGTAAMPGRERGAVEPVLDGSEMIGMVVRTVEGAKPVFVSAGHKVDLMQAVDIALKATRTHRLTEPIWQADQASKECRDGKTG